MPYKKVDITGEGTEVVDGGRGTPVDVVQEPTKELEKADTRFIASDKAPKKTVVDSDLQVLGKYYDKDGNEIGGGGLGDAITADEIDSESATSGKVLTADGDGGASWEDVESGLTEADLANGVGDIKVKEFNNEVFSHKLTFDIGEYDDNPTIKAVGASGNEYGERIIHAHLGKFVAPSFFRENIETFTPATTGNITMTEAYNYVRKIQSGVLCVVNNNSVFHIEFYNPNAATDTDYLILSYQRFDSSGVLAGNANIKYVVQGTNYLTVVFEDNL